MKPFLLLCTAACIAAVLGIIVEKAAFAQGGAPKVGDKSPVFEGTDEQGKTWKSSDVVGKKILVVYFYPADFTGGCTAQACGFRDDMQPLTEKGVEVVGVSGDSVKAHAAFKKEHNLPFTLLADGDGTVAAKFGVKYTKKQGNITFKGETFIREGLAQRHTIVIGKDGNVAARYDVKDAKGDSKEVLKVVEKLQK